MDNPTEIIKRNRYFIEGAPDIPHSSRDHADDFQEYHLPLMRMHHAHLHDPGIAGGLAVGVTVEGNAVEVQPGVAVDGRGELITLSADGQADISLAAPGEPDRQIVSPFRLGTDGHAGQTRYLTIQFAERLRLAQGAGGKLEQTPWLRLQPVSGDGAFVDDGLAIVLAIVEVDAGGSASVRVRDPALPHGRRLMGNFTAELRIRRAADNAGQAGQDLAAAIAADPAGGLRVVVAEATDAVRFSRAGGDAFATFAVQADATQVHGSLSIQGNQQNLGELQVAGLTRLGGGTLTVEAAEGNVGIGTATPTQKLEVAGKVKAAAFEGDGAGLTGVSGTDATRVAKNGDTMSGPLSISAGGTALRVFGGNVGIGTSNASFPLSMGRSIGNTKLALYETGANYAYGLGVSAGALRLHIAHSQARFAFFDSNAENAKELMTLGGSGNLVVTGSARKPGGGSWADLSDRKLKTDIRQLEGALDTLLRLRGVRFQWREPEKHGNLTGPQMGMVAQEVERVIPDWVSTTPQGYKLLSIRGFEALTVEALRELRTALSALQARNAAFEALLTRLETRHG